MIHLQPDLTQLYPHFNESDMWFTRDHYKEFLLDRLQTIDSHRQLTANNMNDGENSSHCIRGLELFEDDSTNEHFKSKKKLYYSTIKMEQMRQGMLGIKDPQRFRDLVAAQSDLDLHRARELATQDEREIYPFRAHCATQEVRTTSQDRNQSSTMPVSSFSDMHRQNNLMVSIHGSAPPSASERSRSTGSSPTPNSFHENEAVAEFGAASVVSDVSSTSSSESSANGKSVFADESIRKLQERSMRRLMGIYNNNNGEGTEGPSETNSLFKFARRDSLLGIGNSTTSATANTSNQNNVRAVTEDNAPSQQEQIMEMIHRRQLLQDHQEQQQAQSYDDTTPCLQDQIVEMVVRRQLLQDHLQQQQQEQQQQQRQQALSEDTSTSLVEQVMEMVHRRQLLEDQQQEQQQHHHDASSIIAAAAAAMGQSIGGDNNTSKPNSMVEQFLIQQQQHQQEHKLRMQQALMAMNATRFPIRRDTLSHVHSNAIHDGTSVNHHPLPWNVTSMT